MIEQAEDSLSQFFGVSLDLLCIVGADGYFKKLNPAWEKILGYNSKELCAKPIIAFVHPEDQTRTTVEFKKLSEGSNILDFEHRYLCKDGTYKWLSWKATRVGDLLYSAARDITLFRQDEALKIQEGQRLNSIIQLQSEICRSTQESNLGETLGDFFHYHNKEQTVQKFISKTQHKTLKILNKTVGLGTKVSNYFSTLF